MNKWDKIKEEIRERKNLNRSSPLELWVESLFNRSGIYKKTHYKREQQVGNYLIDFAFLREKLAVELDGKQYHTEYKDKKKDNYLKDNGWNVKRIKSTECWNPRKFVFHICDILEIINIEKNEFVQELLQLFSKNADLPFCKVAKTEIHYDPILDCDIEINARNGEIIKEL